MKKLSVYMGLAMAALSFASCQKELDQIKAPATQEAAVAAVSQSKPDLLTSSAWHLTDLTSGSASTVATATEGHAVSMIARLKPSVRDNTFTYAVGGTYTVNEGQLKLREQAPQQVVGTWKLSEAGDSLLVTQQNSVHRYGVAELTATTLRLTHSEGAGPAATQITSVFSH